MLTDASTHTQHKLNLPPFLLAFCSDAALRQTLDSCGGVLGDAYDALVDIETDALLAAEQGLDNKPQHDHRQPNQRRQQHARSAQAPAAAPQQRAIELDDADAFPSLGGTAGGGGGKGTAPAAAERNPWAQPLSYAATAKAAVAKGGPALAPAKQPALAPALPRAVAASSVSGKRGMLLIVFVFLSDLNLLEWGQASALPRSHTAHCNRGTFFRPARHSDSVFANTSALRRRLYLCSLGRALGGHRRYGQRPVRVRPRRCRRLRAGAQRLLPPGHHCVPVRRQGSGKAAVGAGAAVRAADAGALSSARCSCSSMHHA